MRTASKHALGFWLGGLCVAVTLLWFAMGPPTGVGAAGESIGRLFAHFGLASLFTWMTAKKKDPAWSWLKFGMVWFVWIVVLALVTTVGRSKAEETLPHPIHAAWPAEWTFRIEQGVSSAPQDRAAGVRELGIRTDANGAASMGMICMWLTDGAPDVARELRGILDGMERALEDPDAWDGSVDKLRWAGLDGYVGQLVIRADGEIVARNSVALAASPRCLATSVYAAAPADFDRFMAEAKAIRDAVRFD